MSRRSFVVVVAGLMAVGGPMVMSAERTPQRARALANECLVKVNVPQQTCLECLFASKELFAAETGSVSLDILNTRYHVIAVEPLFRRQGLGQLSLGGVDVDRAVVESIAQHPQRLERGAGLGGIESLPSFSQVYRIRFADDVDAREACTAYAQDPAILYAHPNYFVYASDIQMASMPTQELTAAGEAMRGASPTPWSKPLDQPITVAIVDTGLANPSVLMGSARRGWDMTTCEAYDETDRCAAFKARDPEPVDALGQGTRITELLQTVINRGTDPSGETPAVMLLPVQVLNGQGRGVLSNAVAGLLYAIVQGADVVYLDWSTRQPVAQARLFDEAVALANALGVLLVTPAGDEGLQIGGPALGPLPANVTEVLTVAATDLKGKLLSTSNWGSGVELSAVGMSFAGVSSTASRDRVQVPSGSSVAAAYVTAAAALRLARSPHWHVDELRSMIRATADHPTRRPFSVKGGYGQLNLQQLLQAGEAISVLLVSPGDQETVGDWLEIGGTIRAPEGVAYELSYGSGDAPTSWHVLSSAQLTRSVERGIMGDWQTKDVSDGTYTIHLAVTDGQGRIYEYRRRLSVDNGNERAQEASSCPSCGPGGRVPLAPVTASSKPSDVK